MAEKPSFREFEEIVAEILRLHGFDVSANVRQGIFEADLIVTSKQGKTAVVEVKAYSSRSINLSALVRAANQLIHAKQVFKADRAILAVSAILTDLEKDVLQRALPALIVYDVSELTFLAAMDGDLYQRLTEFLRRSQPFSSPSTTPPMKVDPTADVNQPTPKEVSISAQPSKAKELGENLRKIPPGGRRLQGLRKCRH